MSASKTLRVHQRTVFLDGSRWSVLSPRPSEPARFATYGTDRGSHILCDAESAGLLARLLWALAFQRRERTMVVIDPSRLLANPIDGKDSLPIVLVNIELGTPSVRALEELLAAQPWMSGSEGTVRLRTHGLDEAIDQESAPVPEADGEPAWVQVLGNVLLAGGPPSMLRVQAYRTAMLSPRPELPDRLDIGQEVGTIHVLSRTPSPPSDVGVPVAAPGGADS